MSASQNVKYRRVLLKLSGEVLGDRAKGECLSDAALSSMAASVKRLVGLGVQTAVVLGGGNIFRGLSGEGKGVDRSLGDSMGMLATVINGLALKNALAAAGVPARVLTAVEMPRVAALFTRDRALRILEKGEVAILAGGTGNPYFSTDSAAALRACEIGADILLKATKVDGVYTADPKKDPTATRYDRLTFAEALAKRLKVMDAAAFALCMDNAIPVQVFDFYDATALERIVRGETVGTLVCGA